MGEVRRGAIVVGHGAWVPWLSASVVVAATASALMVLLSWAGIELLAPLPGEQPALALQGPGAALVVAACTVCWVALPLRAIAAAGLALALLAWCLPALATGSGISPELARLLASTSGLAAAGSALVPAWGLRRPRDRWPLVVALVAAVCSCGVLVLGYDPFRDLACLGTCPELAAPLADALGPRAAMGVRAIVVVVASAAAVEVVRRAQGAPRMLRWAAVVAASLTAAAAVTPWARWGEDEPSSIESALIAGALTSLALAVAALCLRVRRTRAAVADLVVRLENSDRYGSIGEVAAVRVKVTDQDRWVDARGHEVAEPSGGVVLLTEGGAPVVGLLLNPGADAEDVHDVLGPAARLAIDNVRLAVLGDVRLREVQESQRRIVRAADAERSRIERDLHDGTQQRLVAAEMRLRLAASRVDAASSRVLVEAADDVRSALSALRFVSHGSHAGLMDSQGLAAAIEDVVDPRFGVSISLSDETRIPSDARMAALTAVSAITSLETADDADGRLQLTQMDEELVLRVELSGVEPDMSPGDVIHAQDRVGAAGGSWHQSGHENTTTLEVRLPCVSS